MSHDLNENEEVLIDVAPEDEGKRLDIVVAASFEHTSRSRLKELILESQVAVNGKVTVQPRFKVKANDQIVINLPPPLDANPEPQDISLDIIFEDDDLIVINKPIGLVVHPAPGAPDGTLVNALLFHCGETLSGIGGVKRPGIVHRLDKNTSGVMVAAKNERTHNHLAKQFADHGLNGPLRRAYTAFVWGHHSRFSGTIDAPIGRDPHNRQKQAINQSGKHAVTHYQTQQRFIGEGWQMAKIECRLETGRTHQIRVHMAHAGHPIVADPAYASGYATKANRLPDRLKSIVTQLGRQALHATELGFEHPKKDEFMLFTADLPKDMAELDQQLQAFDSTRVA